MVRERTMKRPVTLPGITLAAPPPRVITPWTWSPGGSCWRRRPRATWEIGHGIEGVHAFPGGGRRMGLPAGEVHIEVGDGQAGGGQAFSRPRVDHHGGVHALEGAPFQHEDLASTALFGRGAQHAHLQTPI